MLLKLHNPVQWCAAAVGCQAGLHTANVLSEYLISTHCCCMLLQKIKSLQTVGELVPVRMVIDEVNLYLSQVLPGISRFRALLLDVQAQFVDAFEDLARMCFVHGLEDALAARDARHQEKVNAVADQDCLLMSTPYFYLRSRCVERQALGCESSLNLLKSSCSCMSSSVLILSCMPVRS